VASLHGVLVLRHILGIGREVDDVNLLKVWVVGVGKKLRDASCALGLSLLAAEDGQISWKGLHKVLLAAKVVLDISQFGQGINNPSLILSILSNPGTLVSGWGLTSLDFVLVDGEQGLAYAAGLVHLTLDGACGDTWSVELGDQVKVQLFLLLSARAYCQRICCHLEWGRRPTWISGWAARIEPIRRSLSIMVVMR
jgi:hypothetical protein